MLFLPNYVWNEERTCVPPVLSQENLRHLGALIRRGRNPVATVYESIGADFFLSPAPGWLNLGLWEGPGDEAEAVEAVRRLVRTVAAPLPRAGVIVDVGNGLGAQDPVIAEVSRPRQLVAVNITEFQLHAGRRRLEEAGASPVVGDATRLPLRARGADGVISVEAAFHFPSRRSFFDETRRVLRAGGVLSFSDVTAERKVPRTPGELAAGLTNLRVWGMRASTLASRSEVMAQLADAGFVDVHADAVGERVFPQAINLMRRRLRAAADESPLRRAGSAAVLAQWDLLYRRGMIEYVLIRATSP
jgi:ubiquinone/menaquinone biosynthesis C-methylase UbiE